MSWQKKKSFQTPDTRSVAVCVYIFSVKNSSWFQCFSAKTRCQEAQNSHWVVLLQNGHGSLNGRRDLMRSGWLDVLGPISDVEMDRIVIIMIIDVGMGQNPGT